MVDAEEEVVDAEEEVVAAGAEVAAVAAEAEEEVRTIQALVVVATVLQI